MGSFPTQWMCVCECRGRTQSYPSAIVTTLFLQVSNSNDGRKQNTGDILKNKNKTKTWLTIRIYVNRSAKMKVDSQNKSKLTTSTKNEPGLLAVAQLLNPLKMKTHSRDKHKSKSPTPTK